MSFSERLAADFEAEAQSTRKMLEAVPEESFAWKPHDKSWDLATLAGHVAEGPSWVHGMMEAELDFAAAPERKPFVPANKSELLAKFDETAAGVKAALGGRDDAFMEEIWTMKNGDAIMMQAPRHEAIRSIAVHHTIHHRGQLSVYLRMVETPVPSTYGPTADFPDFG